MKILRRCTGTGEHSPEDVMLTLTLPEDDATVDAGEQTPSSAQGREEPVREVGDEETEGVDMALHCTIKVSGGDNSQQGAETSDLAGSAWPNSALSLLKQGATTKQSNTSAHVHATAKAELTRRAVLSVAV